eukprot:12731-Eustigmatos_ZCMA.PRE.1
MCTQRRTTDAPTHLYPLYVHPGGGDSEAEAAGAGPREGREEDEGEGGGQPQVPAVPGFGARLCVQGLCGD